ncbi:MAG: hypothetical protein ACI81P_000890, partial [Neolewinella sp.]
KASQITPTFNVDRPLVQFAFLTGHQGQQPGIKGRRINNLRLLSALFYPHQI